MPIFNLKYANVQITRAKLQINEKATFDFST